MVFGSIGDIFNFDKALDKLQDKAEQKLKDKVEEKLTEQVSKYLGGSDSDVKEGQDVDYSSALAGLHAENKPGSIPNIEQALLSSITEGVKKELAGQVPIQKINQAVEEAYSQLNSGQIKSAPDALDKAIEIASQYKVESTEAEISEDVMVGGQSPIVYKDLIAFMEKGVNHPELNNGKTPESYYEKGRAVVDWLEEQGANLGDKDKVQENLFNILNASNWNRDEGRTQLQKYMTALINNQNPEVSGKYHDTVTTQTEQAIEIARALGREEEIPTTTAPPVDNSIPQGVRDIFEKNKALREQAAANFQPQVQIKASDSNAQPPQTATGTSLIRDVLPDGTVVEFEENSNEHIIRQLAVEGLKPDVNMIDELVEQGNLADIAGYFASVLEEGNQAGNINVQQDENGNITVAIKTDNGVRELVYANSKPLMATPTLPTVAVKPEISNPLPLENIQPPRPIPQIATVNPDGSITQTHGDLPPIPQIADDSGMYPDTNTPQIADGDGVYRPTTSPQNPVQQLLSSLNNLLSILSGFLGGFGNNNQSNTRYV